MKSPRSNSGFSLIEVTIAIGIAAFCLLAIFGLLPTGMSANRDSVSSTIGAGLASGIVADLRATATRDTASTRYGIKPSENSEVNLKEDGSKAGSAQDADYVASISIAADKLVDNTNVHLSNVHIAIQAPAAAAVKNRRTVFETWTAITQN